MQNNACLLDVEILPIGYALQKIICDRNGIPVNYEFVEVNKAFEDLSGYQKSDIIGKRITEIIPEVTTSKFDWIKVYGDLALSGGNIEFDQYVNALKGWYRINAHSPKKGYCAIFFTDISKEMQDIEEKNILLTSINDIIFELNEDFVFENIIVSEDNYLFMPRQSIIGKKIQELFFGELAETIVAAFKRAVTTGQKEHITYKSIIPGEDKWYRADIFCRDNVHGRRKYIVSVSEITKQKKVELELESKTAELERFFNINLDLLCIANMEGDFIKVNISWEKVLGYTAAELAERKFLDFVHPDDMKDTIATMSRLRNKEQILFFVNRYQCKDGSYRYIEWCSQPYGNMIYAAARDITDRRRTEEKILYLSFHDQLTGLYNRRFYEEELKRVDQENNLPLSIVMADVNGLKLANDAFGHLVGDEMLIRIAETFLQECQSGEIVSRIGGDEFVIILPRTKKKDVESLVCRIIQSIGENKVNRLDLSVSFGFATKIAANENIEDTFKKAEELMYQHKLLESPKVREKAIQTILTTMYEIFPEEQEHTEEVSKICEFIGKQLEFNQHELAEIKTAGLLHDIGKININEKILHKQEKLSDSEWDEIKRHAETGYRILNAVNELSYIAKYVLHHHEHWDGSGYPDGQKETEIPLYSRIIGIADAYHAMRKERPYRKAFTAQETLDEIKKKAGSQFDPKVALKFVEGIKELN